MLPSTKAVMILGVFKSAKEAFDDVFSRLKKLEQILQGSCPKQSDKVMETKNTEDVFVVVKRIAAHEGRLYEVLQQTTTKTLGKTLNIGTQIRLEYGIGPTKASSFGFVKAIFHTKHEAYEHKTFLEESAQPPEKLTLFKNATKNRSYMSSFVLLNEDPSASPDTNLWDKLRMLIGLFSPYQFNGRICNGGLGKKRGQRIREAITCLDDIKEYLLRESTIFPDDSISEPPAQKRSKNDNNETESDQEIMECLGVSYEPSFEIPSRLLECETVASDVLPCSSQTLQSSFSNSAEVLTPKENDNLEGEGAQNTEPCLTTQIDLLDAAAADTLEVVKDMDLNIDLGVPFPDPDTELDIEVSAVLKELMEAIVNQEESEGSISSCTSKDVMDQMKLGNGMQ